MWEERVKIQVWKSHFALRFLFLFSCFFPSKSTEPLVFYWVILNFTFAAMTIKHWKPISSLEDVRTSVQGWKIFIVPSKCKIRCVWSGTEVEKCPAKHLWSLRTLCLSKQEDEEPEERGEGVHVRRPGGPGGSLMAWTHFPTFSQVRFFLQESGNVLVKTPKKHGVRPSSLPEEQQEIGLWQ